MAKTPSGGHGTGFIPVSGATVVGNTQKAMPELSTTLIDKSVTMRESLDMNLNRAA